MMVPILEGSLFEFSCRAEGGSPGGVVRALFGDQEGGFRQLQGSDLYSINPGKGHRGIYIPYIPR